MKRLHARLIGIGWEAVIDALLNMDSSRLVFISGSKEARDAWPKRGVLVNETCAGLVDLQWKSATAHVRRCKFDWQQCWVRIDRHSTDRLGLADDCGAQIVV